MKFCVTQNETPEKLKMSRFNSTFFTKQIGKCDIYPHFDWQLFYIKTSTFLLELFVVFLIRCGRVTDRYL